MNNAQMKEGRFLRLHEYRQKYQYIAKHLKAGHRIQITTYTHSKVYASLDHFKMSKNGVFVRRGKSWDCLNFCSVRAVA